MAEKWVEDYIGRGIFEGAPDTPEEVDAYLREQGYDPDSLVSRMKIRISEALDNAKARMEREAAMQRANERRAAELAELEALRQVAAMARELVAVTELWPSIIWDEFRGRLDMYPAWKATQEALTALDAPAPEPPYRDIAAPAPKPGVKLCAVPGCFSPAEGGILCAEHYSEHVWEGVDDD